jgi:hypothetical protein
MFYAVSKVCTRICEIVTSQQFQLDVALWRACNPTPSSPCLTSPVDYLFASRHKGPGFKSPGEYLCETGIFLLALSCYIGDPDVINNFCGLI